MVFSSFEFLHAFLPLALLLGFAAWFLLGTRAANVMLVLLSLAFYVWGPGVEFLWLIGVSIACNYGLAILVDWARRERPPLLPWVIGGVVLFNLGLLGYFKYANFAVAQFAAASGTPIAWQSVALPIGISFFTFHAMSYVFDVARQRAVPLKSPVEYALYILLFPQLVAGPIVRYQTIADQLLQRDPRLDDVVAGLQRFAHGLVKKVLIADAAGAIADPIFALSGAELTPGAAWLGVLAYTVQIYFDFSGYTDMAIGLARIFGFRFPENFNRPYSSLSISDFWRRWHMSLSSWFRDYLYIPLGGSQKGELATYRNLFIVFLLTGLWHGASWTFVLWGAYHGTLVLLERLLGLRAVEDADLRRGLPELVLRRVVTLLLVMIGWVMFRAGSMEQIGQFLSAMVRLDQLQWPVALAERFANRDLAFAALGLLVFLLPREFRGTVLYASPKLAVRWAAAGVIIGAGLVYALMRVASGSFSPFLYFQF
ncbi:MAG TPA: MBOAT family O-acyltransferase [Solimonas sp.]|nr:MBOAT family O-acyltransferase [Solimonas sp.]